MRAQLAAPTLAGPGERARGNPLAVMNQEQGDPVLAYLQAWAVVGDVLTFYQERIADESTLSTAREPLSAYAIVRAFGFQPRAAVSARTYLAFEVAGEPRDRPLTLPAGIPVGNVPAPGGAPAIFETGAPVLAYPAWNRVDAVPDEAPVAVRLPPNATRIVLAGTDPIPAGTSLVLRERGPSSEVLVAVQVAESIVDAASSTTLVRWLPSPAIAGGEEVLDALVLPQRIRPFGALAPPFALAAPAERMRYAQGGVAVRRGDAIRRERQGLDASPIALALTRGGVCGITASAFVRQSASGAWSVGATFPGAVLHSLTATDGGRLAIGTAAGIVFISVDDGRTWLPIGDGVPSLAPRKQPKLAKFDALRLPAVPIRAVAIDESGEVPVIYVATDRGIASIALNGEAWSWRNEGFPGTDPQTGFASCAATSLAFADADGTLLTSTTYGVYRSVRAQGWTRVDGLGSVSQIAALAEGRLVAAGPGGVFLSSDGGVDWTRVAQIDGTPRALAAFGRTIVVGVGEDAWISDDAGRTWQREADPLGTPIAAVAAGPGRTVALAAPFADYHGPDWPGIEVALRGEVLPLDREVVLTAGDVLVVAREDDERIADAYYVRSARTTILSHYGMIGPSTLAVLDRPMNPLVANARSAVVSLGARARAVVPVKRTAPAAPTREIPVPRGLPLLAPGRVVAIEGRSARMMLRGLAGGAVRFALRPNVAGVTPVDLSPDPPPPVTPLLDAAVVAACGASGVVVSRFDGVWQCEDARDPQAAWRALPAPPIAVTSLAWHEGTLYACGRGRSRVTSGVYALTEGRWSAQPELVGAIRRLFVASDASGAAVLWAAGLRGLYERHAGSWVLVDSRFEAVRVRDVCSHGATVLVAADDGVHVRSIAVGWARVPGLDDYLVQSVAVGAGGWYAGTRGAGTWVKTANAPWKPLDPQRRSGDVRALCALGAQSVLAAERGVGITDRGRLLPATLASDVRTFVVLPADEREQLVLAFRRIPIATGAGLPLRRFLATLPFVESELETLDAGMLLPGLRRRIESVVGLKLDTVAVVGDTAEAAWRLRGSDVMPVFLLRREIGGLALFEVRVVELDAPPAPLNRQASALRDEQPACWELSDPTGGTKTFVAAANELWYAPARVGAPTIAEVATVAAHESGVLRLHDQLRYAYDPRTVDVAANLVEATHGATIAADEPIASGDGGAPGQQASLAAKPLTNLLVDGKPIPQLDVWLRANLAQDSLLAAASLARRDDGAGAVRWKRVDDFVSQGPFATVYAVRQEADGSATVRFGDGVHGRRLATGTNNVIARYRVGGGPNGNVERNQLTLFQRSAPGADRVRNPVAALGGAAADGLEELRVPDVHAIVSLQRVVTTADLEDYVRAWPGVAKVDVVRRPLAQRRVVSSFVVTYASGPGDAVDVGALLQAVRQAGAAGWEITIVPARKREFEVEARLFLVPGADADQTLARARDALARAYSFDRRNLREGVLAAAVVALLQGVRDVRAVALDVFHERGTVKRTVERIAGDDGESGEGASLLLLDVEHLRLTRGVSAP
jgi:hypothetical protein